MFEMQREFRSFTVCVGFSDLLTFTLKRIRQWFSLSESWVITAPSDHKTIEIAIREGARVYSTNAFYRDGADFNKGRAIEECLDVMVRHGWFVSVDADVVLPITDAVTPRYSLDKNRLYSAKRRMLYDVTKIASYMDDQKWGELPYKRDYEHAGYFTVWHADSEYLRDSPQWFSTKFKNASGYDSVFNEKWPPHMRSWLDMDVLHVGFDGQNWCGRATPLVDGTMPDDAGKHRDRLREVLEARREHGFSKETIDGSREL